MRAYTRLSVAEWSCDLILSSARRAEFRKDGRWKVGHPDGAEEIRRAGVVVASSTKRREHLIIHQGPSINDIPPKLLIDDTFLNALSLPCKPVDRVHPSVDETD